MFWRRETRSQGSGYAFPGFRNTSPSGAKRPPRVRKHVPRVAERFPRCRETSSQGCATRSHARGTRSQVSRNTVMMPGNNVMMSRNTFPGYGCNSHSGGDRVTTKGAKAAKGIGRRVCSAGRRRFHVFVFTGFEAAILRDVFANVATADGVVVSAHNAPALVATFGKTSPSVAAIPRRDSAA